jgi:hypothetical protein
MRGIPLRAAQRRATTPVDLALRKMPAAGGSKRGGNQLAGTSDQADRFTLVREERKPESGSRSASGAPIGSSERKTAPQLRATIAALKELRRNLGDAKVSEHHGGMHVLGGFSILDTKHLITPEIYRELLAEYRKLVPKDRSVTQQSFYVPPESKQRGLVPELIRAHRDVSLQALRQRDPAWISHGSSLLLLNQQLQSEFHDHLTDAERRDPQHRVCRQNASTGIHRLGTLFNSPRDDEPFQSQSGDTAIFNEGARHMSPPDAHDGFFMLHFFAKPEEG